MKKLQVYLSIESGLNDVRLAIVDLFHRINHSYIDYNLYYVIDSEQNINCNERGFDKAFFIVRENVEEIQLRLSRFRESKPTCIPFLYFLESDPNEQIEAIIEYRNTLLNEKGHFCNVETLEEIELNISYNLHDYALKQSHETIDVHYAVNGLQIMFGNEIIACATNIPYIFNNKKYKDLIQQYDELNNTVIAYRPNSKEDIEDKVKLIQVEVEISKIISNLLHLNNTILNAIIESNNATIQEANTLLRLGKVQECKSILEEKYKSNSEIYDSLSNNSNNLANKIDKFYSYR